MNEEMIAAYASAAIAGLAFILGLVAGLIASRNPENEGFRYGVFYSIFAGVCGAGLFLSTIIFYFLYLDGVLAVIMTLFAVGVAAGFVWLARSACRGGFGSFLTLSILPAVGLWPIPITIWNIYYATKNRKYCGTSRDSDVLKRSPR